MEIVQSAQQWALLYRLHWFTSLWLENPKIFWHFFDFRLGQVTFFCIARKFSFFTVDLENWKSDDYLESVAMIKVDQSKAQKQEALAKNAFTCIKCRCKSAN